MLRDAFNIWSVTDMGYAFLLQSACFRRNENGESPKTGCTAVAYIL